MTIMTEKNKNQFRLKQVKNNRYRKGRQKTGTAVGLERPVVRERPHPRDRKSYGVGEGGLYIMGILGSLRATKKKQARVSYALARKG